MLDTDTSIRAAIDSYLQDPSQLGLTTELASLARHLVALPVYADMGAALLIRPNGDVLEVSTDQSWADPKPISRVVTDSDTIALAYDKCVMRFPHLRTTIDLLKAGKRSDI